MLRARFAVVSVLPSPGIGLVTTSDRQSRPPNSICAMRVRSARNCSAEGEPTSIVAASIGWSAIPSARRPPANTGLGTTIGSGRWPPSSGWTAAGRGCGAGAAVTGCGETATRAGDPAARPTTGGTAGAWSPGAETGRRLATGGWADTGDAVGLVAGTAAGGTALVVRRTCPSRSAFSSTR